MVYNQVSKDKIKIYKYKRVKTRSKHALLNHVYGVIMYHNSCCFCYKPKNVKTRNFFKTFKKI